MTSSVKMTLDTRGYWKPGDSREFASVTKFFVDYDETQLKKDILDIKPEDKKMDIDFNAEFIRDAYQYWCYPIWIVSGLAGCVLKWGTFEDNAKPEDDYITWEEWNK